MVYYICVFYFVNWNFKKIWFTKPSSSGIMYRAIGLAAQRFRLPPTRANASISGETWVAGEISVVPVSIPGEWLTILAPGRDFYLIVSGQAVNRQKILTLPDKFPENYSRGKEFDVFSRCFAISKLLLLYHHRHRSIFI